MLKFHKSIDRANHDISSQVHKRGFIEGSPVLFPILSWLNNRFLEFEIFRNKNEEAITVFKLVEYYTNIETDLAADINKLDITIYDLNFEVISYMGYKLGTSLKKGYYHLEIEDSEDLWYSNVFKIEF